MLPGMCLKSMDERQVASGVEEFSERFEAGDTKIYYYGRTPCDDLGAPIPEPGVAASVFHAF